MTEIELEKKLKRYAQYTDEYAKEISNPSPNYILRDFETEEVLAECEDIYNFQWQLSIRLYGLAESAKKLGYLSQDFKDSLLYLVDNTNKPPKHESLIRDLAQYLNKD